MATQIRKLLVPHDFSDAADGALRYAVDLAAQLGASIVVVHAWQLSAYASPSSDLAKGMERDLARDLEKVVAKHASAGVAIAQELRLGIPYVEICASAKAADADVIVMGTTGKTGIEHFLLGSVAERVVRTSTVPVLTVRHTSPKA